MEMLEYEEAYYQSQTKGHSKKHSVTHSSKHSAPYDDNISKNSHSRRHRRKYSKEHSDDFSYGTPSSQDGVIIQSNHAMFNSQDGQHSLRVKGSSPVRSITRHRRGQGEPDVKV